MVLTSQTSKTMKEVLSILLALVLVTSLKAQDNKVYLSVIQYSIAGSQPEARIHKNQECPYVIDNAEDNMNFKFYYIPESTIPKQYFVSNCSYCFKDKKYRYNRKYIGLCETSITINNLLNDYKQDFFWSKRDSSILLEGVGAILSVSHEKITAERSEQIDAAHVATKLSTIAAGFSVLSATAGLASNNARMVSNGLFQTDVYLSHSERNRERERQVESMDIFFTILNVSEKELQVTDLIDGRSWYLLPGEYHIFYDFDILDSRYRVAAKDNPNILYIDVNANNKLLKVSPQYMYKGNIVFRLPQISIDDNHYINLKKKSEGDPVMVNRDTYEIQDLSEEEYLRLVPIK